MKLDVPLVRQPKHSVDCGICGVSMVLSYYQKNTAYKQLQKAIRTAKDGTYMPQLGLYLIEQGFNAELITLNPKLFTIHDKNITQKEIMKRCKDHLKKAKGPDKRSYNFLIAFMKKGGKVTPKIPTTKDIASEIKQGRPVLALITANMLTAKKPKFNFHFNLITGIDKEYIYVNDPLWDARGGRKKHKIEHFMYALYATAYGCSDNASLIKIKPRT